MWSFLNYHSYTLPFIKHFFSWNFDKDFACTEMFGKIHLRLWVLFFLAARVTQAFAFLRNLFSASFLLLVAIRVLSVIHVVSLVAKRIADEQVSNTHIYSRLDQFTQHSVTCVWLACWWLRGPPLNSFTVVVQQISVRYFCFRSCVFEHGKCKILSWFV